MNYARFDPDTKLQVHHKRVGETREFAMDFSAKMAAASLVAVTSVTAQRQNKVPNSQAVVTSDHKAEGVYAKFTISDGTANERYLVTVRARDSNGQVLVGQGMLYVHA